MPLLAFLALPAFLGAAAGLAGAAPGGAPAAAAEGAQAAAPEGAPAKVSGVRFGDHGSHTRVVLDLSQRVAFQHFSLADPYRVVVDLPPLHWDIPGITGVAGLVSEFRYGMFRQDTSRLVLDVKGPVVVDKAFILEPKGDAGTRLVLDLKRVGVTAFEKRKRPPSVPSTGSAPHTGSPGADVAALPMAPAPEMPPTSPIPKAPPEKRVIIIDPGHGGVDPGATGRSGKYEKQITLSMARELKRKLEATGRYKVVLTRRKDIFHRLRERLKSARQAGGDLFISLHADSVKNRKIRGLSVYTLSENASDKEAELLAKAENKSDLIAGIDLTGETPEVTNILIDLAQRETMNLSARFANFLIQALRREVKLLRKTHRFAGFAVLKAPDIPSALVELGYLSNRTEEKLLQDPKYRGRLATAVVSAVDRFFEWKDNLNRP